MSSRVSIREIQKHMKAAREAAEGIEQGGDERETTTKKRKRMAKGGPTESSPNSLWDKKCRSDALIDKHLLLLGDKEKMRKVGPISLARWVEVHSIYTTSIVREIELKLEEAQKDHILLKEKFSEEERVMKEKIKSLETQLESNLKYEERAKIAEKEVGQLKKQLDEVAKTLESEQAVHAESIKLWSDKESAWNRKEASLKTKVRQQLVDSFQNCLAQVKILYPDLDLSMCGPFKEVKEGEIISPSDSEEIDDTAAN